MKNNWLPKLTLPLIVVCFVFLGKFQIVFSQEVPCEPDNVTEAQNPRPAPCNICQETESLSQSCATLFAIYDQISYYKNQSEVIKESWEGSVIVDPQEIKIPFAKDIADYLEGTNEYYQNYSNQNLITNYQGVLRKLTPFEYQNQLKKNLINRAIAEDIHNYQVEFKGRLCWQMPFMVEVAKYLVEKIGIDLPEVTNYCLFDDLENPSQWIIMQAYKASRAISNLIPIPGIGDLTSLTEWLAGRPGMVHYSYLSKAESTLKELDKHRPPDPREENYQEDFIKWAYDPDGTPTSWYKLWQTVPMISREDLEGKIIPYLKAEHPEDLFEIDEEAIIEKVPQLARLYEGSQIINQIFLPTTKEIEEIETLLREEMEPCFKENYLTSEEGDKLCCSLIVSDLQAVEEFSNSYYPCDPNIDPSCLEEVEKEVSREIGVELLHPYLNEIWQASAHNSSGFFNIFRPHNSEAFEDIDAADETTDGTIKYSYSSGEAAPEKGLFFFSHLGGVQKAEEWVVNTALKPFELQQEN